MAKKPVTNRESNDKPGESSPKPPTIVKLEPRIVLRKSPATNKSTRSSKGAGTNVRRP